MTLDAIVHFITAGVVMLWRAITTDEFMNASKTLVGILQWCLVMA